MSFKDLINKEQQVGKYSIPTIQVIVDAYEYRLRSKEVAERASKYLGNDEFDTFLTDFSEARRFASLIRFGGGSLSYEIIRSEIISTIPKIAGMNPIYQYSYSSMMEILKMHLTRAGILDKPIMEEGDMDRAMEAAKNIYYRVIAKGSHIIGGNSSTIKEARTHQADNRYMDVKTMQLFAAIPNSVAYDSYINYGVVDQLTRREGITTHSNSPVIVESPYEDVLSIDRELEQDHSQITERNTALFTQLPSQIPNTTMKPGLSYYHSDFNVREAGYGFAPLTEPIVSVDSYSGSSVSGMTNKARVSYGVRHDHEVTPDQLERNKKLLKRLIKDNHGSVFEHNQIVFRLVIPNYIMKQFLRHRIAVNPNEESGRYSDPIENLYIPTRFRIQSDKNHQGGRDEYLGAEDAREVYKDFFESSYIAFTALKKARSKYNLSKEQARGILPFAMYTRCYLTFNMRSLMHFLNLRLSEHAQYEAREISKLMALAAMRLFPEFFDMLLSIEDEHNPLNPYAISWMRATYIRKAEFELGHRDNPTECSSFHSSGEKYRYELTKHQFKDAKIQIRGR